MLWERGSDKLFNVRPGNLDVKTGIWYSIYKFTRRFPLWNHDYDLNVDFFVDSKSLTLVKKCNIRLTR